MSDYDICLKVNLIFFFKENCLYSQRAEIDPFIRFKAIAPTMASNYISTHSVFLVHNVI